LLIVLTCGCGDARDVDPKIEAAARQFAEHIRDEELVKAYGMLTTRIRAKLTQTDFSIEYRAMLGQFGRGSSVQTQLTSFPPLSRSELDEYRVFREIPATAHRALAESAYSDTTGKVRFRIRFIVVDEGAGLQIGSFYYVEVG
jgi:hypothetical protein